MAEGDVVSGSEIEQAREILRRAGMTRGDSFDLSGEAEESSNPSGDVISSLVLNPQKLIGNLGLTPKQAENVASIIAGGGAGLGHKYLSKYIGSELAGAVGGFLGGFVSKKVIGK